MKKLLLLLTLVAPLSLHAQSKWSVGYRLGLIQENTFSGSMHKNVSMSNQVFTTYRLFSHFDLEAAVQHTQVSDKHPFNREYIAPMMREITDYNAQVFTLSLAAVYRCVRFSRGSIYASLGMRSRAAYGYYESTHVDPWSQKEVIEKTTFNDKVRPLTSVFLGTGINYHPFAQIYLNAQATLQTNNNVNLQGDAFPLYSYDPKLGLQVGLGYNF